MKINWLVEEKAFPENFCKLQGILGDSIIPCKYIPIAQDVSIQKPIKQFDKSIYENDPTFAYGSLQLVKKLKKTKLSVLSFCDLDKFKCQYYYPRFSKYLLQKECIFLPYGSLRDRKDWIFSLYGESFFIRPNDGDKEFTGQVVKKNYFDRELDNLSHVNIFPETLCVLSKTKNIQKEWRIVVGKTNVESGYEYITGSKYIEDDEIIEDKNCTVEQHVIDYVNQVLNDIDYCADPFYTLDVCLSEDKLHILEIGSMSCSGLYGCDLNKVVDSINKYIVEEFNFGR